jgi:catechol 2,3-dioxygenase-like lactoylglutathione lyase family enzyme
VAVKLLKPALDVGIITTNTDKMLAFYRDVLGFSTEEPISFPGFGTVHRLVVGESILRLFEPASAPSARAVNDSMYAATGIRYITLVMSNLNDVVAACREFGVNVSSEPREIRPGVVATTIQDPDGNWLEMQGRRPVPD